MSFGQSPPFQRVSRNSIPRKYAPYADVGTGIRGVVSDDHDANIVHSIPNHSKTGVFRFSPRLGIPAQQRACNEKHNILSDFDDLLPLCTNSREVAEPNTSPVEVLKPTRSIRSRLQCQKRETTARPQKRSVCFNFGKQRNADLPCTKSPLRQSTWKRTGRHTTRTLRTGNTGTRRLTLFLKQAMHAGFYDNQNLPFRHGACIRERHWCNCRILSWPKGLWPKRLVVVGGKTRSNAEANNTSADLEIAYSLPIDYSPSRRTQERGRTKKMQPELQPGRNFEVNIIGGNRPLILALIR